MGLCVKLITYQKNAKDLLPVLNALSSITLLDFNLSFIRFALLLWQVYQTGREAGKILPATQVNL